MSPPLPPPQTRAPRREMRLGCWVMVETARLRAFTSDMGEGGASLQLPPGQAPGVLQPGLRLTLKLPLEAADPLELAAQVIWVDADDRDIRDQPVVGFGVEFLSLSEANQEGVHRFLRDFRHTVLVWDDDPDSEALYESLAEPYRLIRCKSGPEALRVLEGSDVTVLLLGENLGEMDSLQFLQSLSERLPNAKASRIIVSEYTVAGQLQILVNKGRLFSFLRKPFGQRELHQSVQRAVDAYLLATQNSVLLAGLKRANERLQKENAYLRQRFVGASGFEQVVGHSAPLHKALQALRRLQRSDTTVHLQGETGTGKELFARALHLGGARAAGPFVVQGCAGINESLMQSTLFGHLKGAFTGADRDQAGVFQRAHQGTLFLDEVSELALPVQAALLRVLQESEVVPLGGSKALPVEVRIVSASNKDLREEVRQGRFREDLFFRLVVVPLLIPPLRERKGDVSLLALHFLDLHCERRSKNLKGFTYEAMQALERYAWPGNVRELENEVVRIVVMAEEEEKVHLEHLSQHLRPARAPNEEPLRPVVVQGVWIEEGLAFDDQVAALERALVEAALDKSAGNVSQAASALNMDRSRLAKLRLRLGLNR